MIAPTNNHSSTLVIENHQVNGSLRKKRANPSEALVLSTAPEDPPTHWQQVQIFLFYLVSNFNRLVSCSAKCILWVLCCSYTYLLEYSVQLYFIYDIDFVVLILLLYFTDIGILLWSYWAGTRSSNRRFSDIDTKQRECSIYEYPPWVYVSRKKLFPDNIL